MRVTKLNLLDTLYNKCNKIGYTVDIYDVLTDYKILQGTSRELKDALYNYVADRMGLTRERELTNEQWALIESFVGGAN